MKNERFGLKWCFPGLMVVCFFLASNVFAERDPDVLGEDSFYRAAEEMGEGLSARDNPLKAAETYIQRAEEIVLGVKEIISQAKPEYVREVMRDYQDFLTTAIEIIERAKDQGENVREILKKAEKSIKKHLEILSELVSKASGEIKPAFTHALEAVTREKERIADMQKLDRPYSLRKDAGNG